MLTKLAYGDNEFIQRIKPVYRQIIKDTVKVVQQEIIYPYWKKQNRPKLHQFSKKKCCPSQVA